jgi:uncharacterized protein GlcG (DUF336 family)
MSGVTYDRAAALVAAAIGAAEEMGIRVGVVVLNAAAEDIALAKMDGAYRTATTLARKKAFTALNFGVPSAVMAERIQPIGRPVAGAIGVSGGTAAQDIACCEAALAS